MENVRRNYRCGISMVLLALCIAVLLPMGAGRVQAAAPQLSNKNVKLAVKEKKTLKVTGTTKTVKWSSSKKNVAAVKNGRVTAKQPGLTVITAKVGKKKLTCRVRVVQQYSLLEMNKKVNAYLKKHYKAQKWVSFDSEAMLWQGKYTYAIRSQSGTSANTLVGSLSVDPSTGKGTFENMWGMEKKVWKLY